MAHARPRLTQPSVVCGVGIGAHERVVDAVDAFEDLPVHVPLLVVKPTTEDYA